MLKVGDIFFTASGQVGKILSEFNYGDLYKYVGAVWNGAAWVATRYADGGMAVTGATHNKLTGIDKWMDFYTFNMKYNIVDKNWEGTGLHLTNAVLNVKIVKYDDPEKVLVELKKAAFEKITELVKPLGYSVEMEDV